MPTPKYLQFVARVRRTVVLREKRIENHSMKQCWDENDWILPSKYLPSVPNIPAGYKAFWRYDKPEIDIPEHVAYMSRVWTQRHFQQYMGGSRVLPSSVVLKSMDMLTSCGYPWSMSHQNKEQMVSDEPMFKVVGDYSIKIRDSYPCGIVPIWTCSVKGKEMRPVEKIEQNSLRTFTASPIEHSHATNELCLDMNDKFYSSAGRTWSQVGATKYDAQWNALYTRLHKHLNAAALDGKQFDASLLARLLWDQMWIRWEMLAPEYRTLENLLAMMNVYESIIYSLVVLDCGDLLRKSLGNPSGSANTVVDNTMILFRFICIAWIELAFEYRQEYSRKRRLAELPPIHDDFVPLYDDEPTYGYDTFMSNVEAALYGDDDTFSVSDYVREWFTPVRIAEVWTKYGLVTTADKWEYGLLEELTFLSQSFVYVSGLWMPSPETEKVLGSLYLGSSVDDVRFHLLRAYALRIESWANIECRKKIETYINFVHTNYADQLNGSVRGLPWSEIRQVWKTDSQIMRLYSGEESWTPIRSSPAWRLVCVELNPGPTSTGLIMHSLFKVLILQIALTEVLTRQDIIRMPGKGKKVAKAAKKEAKKEVKKIIKKKAKVNPKKAKNVLHGRGGYWSDLGKRLGGHLGGVADEVVGVGKVLTGRGSYRVNRNSLYESGSPPAIMNTKHTAVIRHKEYIGDVSGSTGFAIKQYAINPGVEDTFPWLAAIGLNFEQYEILGCIFEFRSTSGESVGSTNTALGTVIMATEYNSNLPAFTNKLQMENHEYATSICPDRHGIHPIECARRRTPIDELYVRAAAQTGASSTVSPPAYNPLLYDLGQFYIATTGMQSTAVIGELWVSYEIRFLKPALNNSVANGTPYHLYWDSTLGSAPASGAMMQNLRNKNTGIVSLNAGSNGFIMPMGRWLIVMAVAQASTSSTLPTITVTGGSVVNAFSTAPGTGVSATGVFGGPNSPVTCTNWVTIYMVDINQVGGGIGIGACTIGAISTYDFFAVPYPVGYSTPDPSSRKAVDWDPFAVITRRLQQLESRLTTVSEVEEEKYCESDQEFQVCTPEQAARFAPDRPLTRSTADLAESLLARLHVVTDKTAFPRAA